MGMKKFLCAIIGLLFAVPSFANCNLFDSSLLLNINEWTESNGVYSGPTWRLVQYINDNNGLPVTIDPNTQYTISATFGNNDSSLRFGAKYTDGTTEYQIGNLNNGRFSFTTTAGKQVASLVATYGSGTSNVELSNILVEQGSTATPYQPYNPLCETCDGTVHSGQWNQLVQNGNFADRVNNWTSESGVVANAENGVLSVTYQSSGDRGVGQVVEIGSGHKVFVSFDVESYTGKSYIGVFRGSNSASMFRSLGDAVEINKTGHYEQVRTLTALGSGFDYYAAGAGRPVGEGATVSFSNLNVIDLTEMFGAGNEPSTEQEAKAAIAQRANELGISATNNYYAYHANENVSYCISKIKIASTKYVETEFSALNTALANAVATVNTVVTQTIAQAASIATLQSGKQTRPDETCPAGKKCLLVTDENNIPHWYEIVEPLLPAGYIQLQWIESTGTQYIDTGIKANASIVVDMGVLFSRIGSTSVALGTRNGTNTSDTNVFQFGINSNNTFFHRYGISTSDGTGVPVAQTLYDVHLENYKEIIFNGQDTYTNTFEFNPDMDTGGTLYIFATNDISSSGRIFSMAGYITYLSISVDGVLVRDFVPAKNPDGKIGMYDTVNGVFYENEGTGEFIAGPVAE